MLSSRNSTILTLVACAFASRPLRRWLCGPTLALADPSAYAANGPFTRRPTHVALPPPPPSNAAASSAPACSSASTAAAAATLASQQGVATTCFVRDDPLSASGTAASGWRSDRVAAVRILPCSGAPSSGDSSHRRSSGTRPRAELTAPPAAGTTQLQLTVLPTLLRLRCALPLRRCCCSCLAGCFVEWCAGE